MGGVDLPDWNVEKYRASIGGFKWYFKIVTNCFDMMVVNAWALHKIVFGSTWLYMALQFPTWNSEGVNNNFSNNRFVHSNKLVLFSEM